METTELAERLRQRFPDTMVARDEVAVPLGREELLAALTYLKEDPDLSFGFLSDITATDWPGRLPRFWLAYHLLSLEHRHRVRLKVGLAEDDAVAPSATPVFPTANWLEREVFDFYGVVFEGHPDLRRIIMPDDWDGHPLRKDYSLGGVGTQYRGAFIPSVDERNG
ncbi:MAG: NADH-quinone oxidoreductase subunit C [Actinomycetota bacterium]|nr:NADH-quinone oxidoreductase subunit C [Actinomycetota bacterium]